MSGIDPDDDRPVDSAVLPCEAQLHWFKFTIRPIVLEGRPAWWAFVETVPYHNEPATLSLAGAPRIDRTGSYGTIEFDDIPAGSGTVAFPHFRDEARAYLAGKVQFSRTGASGPA